MIFKARHLPEIYKMLNIILLAFVFQLFCSHIFIKFYTMKKFIAPVVLLVLVCTLAVYLFVDFSGVRSSFDADAYLKARSKIDSLEIALWNAQNSPADQMTIRTQLETAWEELSAMRSTQAPGGQAGLAGDASADAEELKIAGLSTESLAWIAGGVVAVMACVAVLVLVLRRRKEIITRRMEAVKAERFKEAKSDLDDATTLAPRPRVKKRSIIADAEEYAAQKRETLAQQQLEAAGKDGAAVKSPSGAEPKVEFEDENGIPENKILTGLPGSKPTLRPTAKERITSAMQNLSDVLRAPRGLSRERTMKLRAQSRNMTGDPNLQGSSPLEMSRFDREASEKLKILQLSRRGFPASAIASQLKIPQDKVETIIKDAQG